MAKILFISGSPREGNTHFILKKIASQIKMKGETIFLKDRNIKHCSGCQACDQTGKCAIRDDMAQIAPKLLTAKIIIIGTPNYYDNVTGLLKDFIDRTNFLYPGLKLKRKKLVSIVVGAGNLKNSRRVVDTALQYFADAHKMDHVLAFCFKGHGPRDLEKNPHIQTKIKTITQKINSLI